jgi:hypothetical protein
MKSDAFELHTFMLPSAPLFSQVISSFEILDQNLVPVTDFFQARYRPHLPYPY